MKITKELLLKMVDSTDFTWVKIKAYEHKLGDGVGPFQEDYWTLLKHHMQESEFLFEVISELADELLAKEEVLDALHFNVRLDEKRPPGEPRWTACLSGINRGDGHSQSHAVADLYMKLKAVQDQYNVTGPINYQSPKPRGEL